MPCRRMISFAVTPPCCSCRIATICSSVYFRPAVIGSPRPPGRSGPSDSTLAHSRGKRQPGAAMLFFGYYVRGGGPWDYKKNGHPEYDPFGNFNFGASGSAAGFGSDILSRMAGWAAEKYDVGRSGNPSLVRALLGQPYPDSAQDRGNYSAGMQYYSNGCYQK